jgi:hypothetical protein
VNQSAGALTVGCCLRISNVPLLASCLAQHRRCAPVLLTDIFDVIDSSRIAGRVAGRVVPGSGIQGYDRAPHAYAAEVAGPADWKT